MSEGERKPATPERQKVVLNEAPKKSGFDIVAKVVLGVLGVGVLLAVLVFGTCLLAFSR